MKDSRTRRAFRLLARAVVVTPFVCTVVIACALPFLGRFLVVEDSLRPVDAIVVLAGATAGRWMEATDLFNEGIARHVILSRGDIEPAELQLSDRGVHLPREPDSGREAMIKLGVPAVAVEVWQPFVDNTAEEAAVARAIAQERGWKRVLVVTSNYHTRRSRLAFGRAFEGSGIEVLVRGTRYERVVPSTWWTRRHDTRWVMSELPKLLAYALGV